MSALPDPIEKLHTAEDLEILSDRGERHELVRGQLREMPPAGHEHGDANNRLTVYVGFHVLKNKLGRGFASETGFKIERDPDTVLSPDWAFIKKERLALLQPGGFASIAPDLVLEVRSSRDSKRVIAEKIERWLQAGVRVVWDLDLQHRILTIHRPGSSPESLRLGDTLIEEELLPGFSLSIRLLFPDEE